MDFIKNIIMKQLLKKFGPFKLHIIIDQKLLTETKFVGRHTPGINL